VRKPVPSLRQRLRLVPTLRDITVVSIDPFTGISVTGRFWHGEALAAGDPRWLAWRSQLYTVRRLPRTWRLMVVVSMTGFADMWEYHAVELPLWIEQRRVKADA
jgi:hypothetical protein